MFKYGNYAVSRLSTDLAAAGSSLSFIDSTNFPTTGTFAAVIWRAGFNSPSDDSSREIVHVRWDGTSWTLLRGREGTTARFWPGNSNVANIITADFLEGIQVFDASLYDNLQCAIDAAYTTYTTLYGGSGNTLNPPVHVYCAPNTIYDITTAIMLRSFVVVHGNGSVVRPASTVSYAFYHNSSTKLHKGGLHDFDIQLTAANQYGLYLDGALGDLYEMSFKNICIQHIESTPTILSGTVGIYMRTAYDNTFMDCIVNLCERAVVLDRGSNNNSFFRCCFRGYRNQYSETVSSTLPIVDINGGISTVFKECRIENNNRLVDVMQHMLYDDGICDVTFRTGGYLVDSTASFSSAYANKFMINRKNWSTAKIDSAPSAVVLKSDMVNFITAPTTPTSDLAAGSGLSTGAYRWVVTYYSTTKRYESSMTDYTTETTSGGNHQVTIHFAASSQTASPYSINKVRIYRTKVGTTGPYYFVAEVAHDSADYTDSTADSSLVYEGIHLNDRVMTGSQWDNSWNTYDPYWITDQAFSGLGVVFDGCMFKADGASSYTKVGTESYETNTPINLGGGSALFTGCVFYDVQTQITGMGSWSFLGNFFYGLSDDPLLPFIRPAFPIYSASYYYDNAMHLTVKNNFCIPVALDGGTYTEAEAHVRPILVVSDVGMLFSKRGTSATDYQTYYSCSACNILDIEQDNIYSTTWQSLGYHSLKLHPDKTASIYGDQYSNFTQSGIMRILFNGTTVFETNHVGLAVYRNMGFLSTVSAPANMPNNSLYVYATDGRLYFKDGSGVSNALY